MKKFSKLSSRVVPINIENVDTDQIIPARFLKAVERKGFGTNLFRDWRYDKEGNLIEDFPLNMKKYSGSRLVAAKNFGSGSSREHAAWAIYDYGFNVVVSSFFADIFKNNALNNGLLPIQVSTSFLSYIFTSVSENPEIEIDIDLPQQTIRCLEREESFSIDGYKKECLIMGYDDVDYLLSLKPTIEDFESRKNH